jgi:chromosomal replication initiation ATPase DnaA
MAEIISPYIFPILKHAALNKKKYPYIGEKYVSISQEDVVQEICDVFKIDRQEFLTKRCRKTYLTDPRKLYCYIRVRRMGAKLVHVCNELCKYDHTTVMHCCRTFEPLFQTDMNYKEKCERVLRRLGLINN